MNPSHLALDSHSDILRLDSREPLEYNTAMSNLSLSEANKALEDITETVEELVAIIASNSDWSGIIEEQKNEINKLKAIIEDQNTEIKRLRRNSPPAF